MFSKDDNDWWDILGGKTVPDADSEVALEARALRGALLTWKERQDLPPLRLPILVKLSQWLQATHEFIDGWLPKESVLEIAYARRSEKQPTPGSISRAKSFELSDKSIVLLVNLSKEEDEKINIDLRAYPSKIPGYLPKGLRATVLDSSGHLIHENEVETPQINSIKLTKKDIFYHTGEKFSVKLYLNNSSIIEYFEV